MRYTQFLIPTLREVPADAEVATDAACRPDSQTGSRYICHIAAGRARDAKDRSDRP